MRVTHTHTHALSLSLSHTLNLKTDPTETGNRNRGPEQKTCGARRHHECGLSYGCRWTRLHEATDALDVRRAHAPDVAH